MAKKRIFEDRVLTANERRRRQADNEFSIDAYMDERFAAINWKRRRKAEKSLAAWVKTYCIGIMLEDAPPLLGNEVLKEMQGALSSHQNYCILMGRGSGKSSYMECAALYAIATGLQKFVVVIASNQIAANNILGDLFRMVAETETPFSEDYPELCACFNLCNGSFHRKQTYRGVTTDISKTSSQLVFARLFDDNGNERPTSGSVIVCRGITSQLRGLRKNTIRPSLVLCDDLQTSEVAANPAAVEKLWDILRKDVYPMAGKNRLSILMTATTILPEDLVARIRADKKAWRCSLYPAVISFPTHTKLWDEYFRLWDDECLTEGITADKHKGSLQFYKDHFNEMNEGAEVFNPKRFSKEDGHLSATQKLLEIRHVIGFSAFQSEYMQNPVEMSTSLPITAAIVNARVGDYKELEVPDENVRYVCASTDLNMSKYLCTVILVFLRDGTVRVVWRKFTPTKISANLPEEEYYTKVYEALSALGKELKAISDGLAHSINGWAIDCNGANWAAALDFARNSRQICGLPCCGFVGKASTQFRTGLKSRLKEAVNRTLLAGDEESRRNGRGRKWMYFDSDYYHEQVHKGFLASIGNLGSISWYKDGNHAKWAAQIAAERLLYKRDRPDGTTDYRWKKMGPDHDALDAVGQGLAAYASQGFATATHVGKPIVKSGTKSRFARRPRIKIV